MFVHPSHKKKSLNLGKAENTNHQFPSTDIVDPTTWDGAKREEHAVAYITKLVKRATKLSEAAGRHHIAIIHDSGASRLLFKDKRLFTSLEELPAPKQVKLKGVIKNQTMIISKQGATRFGIALYDERLPFNLLSQTDAVDQGCGIKYASDRDQFTATDRRANIHTFARRVGAEKLYSCLIATNDIETAMTITDARKLSDQTPPEPKYIRREDSKQIGVGDLVKAFWKGKSNEYDGVVVKENNDGSLNIDYDDGDKEKKVPRNLVRLQEPPLIREDLFRVLNPREIVRAQKARQFHSALMHPNESTFRESLRNNLHHGVAIWAQDAINAHNHYGNCQACIRSKKTRAEAEPTARHATEVGEVLHCDPVMIQGPKGTSIPSLLMAEEITGHLYARSMKTSYDNGDIAESVGAGIAWYAGNNKAVKIVSFDRDSTVPKATPSINMLGVKVVQGSPDQHEKYLEVYARMLKGKMRATALSLEYPVPRRLNMKLFNEAVRMSNQVPNSKTGPLNTPAAHVENQKVNWEHHANWSWGDFVLCTAPRSSNGLPDDAARADHGIVVGHDLSSNSTIEVYLLGSNRFVHREASGHQTIKVKPTKALIDIMERLAIEDGRSLSPDFLLLDAAGKPIIDLPAEEGSAPDPVGRELANQRAREMDLQIARGQASMQAQQRLSAKRKRQSKEDDRIQQEHDGAEAGDAEPLTPSGGGSDAGHAPAPVAGGARAKESQRSEMPLDVSGTTTAPASAVGKRGRAQTQSQQPVAPTGELRVLQNMHRLSREERMAARGSSPPLVDSDAHANAFLADCLEDVETAALVTDTAFSTQDSWEDETDELAMFFEVGVERMMSQNLNGKSDPRLDGETAAFLANIGFSTMMQSNRGEEAALKEVQNFIDHDAFNPREYSSLTPKEKGNTVGCFMFGKEKLTGEYKARMPVLGNEQKETATEKSSPTVKMQALNILIGILAYEQHRGNDWTSNALDIPGAYLNARYPKGENITPIIVRIPPRLAQLFIKVRPDWAKFLHEGCLYVEANAALYGLLEAGRLWYTFFSSKLLEYEFKPSTYDRCVFIHESKQAFVSLYVDDLKIIGLRKIIEETTARISNDFVGAKVQRLGATTPIEYLSREITNPRQGVIEIRQSKLIKKTMQRYEIKGVQTHPCRDDILDTEERPEPAQDPNFVQSGTMAAMYIARNSAPEALFACSALATYVANPTMKAQRATTHLLEYLNGVANMPIVISPKTPRFTMSCDASYSTHPDAKGHTGYAMVWEGEAGLILAYSGKQKLVGRSSWQTELIASHTAGPEVIWARNFLADIGYPQDGPTNFEQDNQGTIDSILKGAADSNRSKHVNVRLFWTKELVDEGIIRLVKVDGDIILADIETKLDSGSPFMSRRTRIRNLV